MRQTRSSAKKQKLGHEPGDIEDQPSRRSQKKEAAKIRSADREARSAVKQPWGSQGQITTERGTPTDQQEEHEQQQQQQLQIAQRNFELASSMDQARIRQLESELAAALDQVTAEKAARATLEELVTQINARLSTLEAAAAAAATATAAAEAAAAAAEATAAAAEAREKDWHQQLDWCKWQKSAPAAPTAAWSHPLLRPPTFAAAVSKGRPVAGTAAAARDKRDGMFFAARWEAATQERKAKRAVSAGPTRAQSQMLAAVVRAARPAAEPAAALTSRTAAKRCFILSGVKEQLAPLAGLKGLDLTTAASKLVTETLGLPAVEQVHVLDVTPIGRPLRPSDTAEQRGRLFIRVDRQS
jgi:hypothetical protein